MGIAINIAGNKLYWTDTQGRIRRANLDGSHIEDVIIGLIAPGQLTLAISEKSTQVLITASQRPPMYWIDAEAGTLHRLMGTK